MGYEVKYFVDDISKEFICAICTMVVENPVETPCEHVFCSECIKGLIAVESYCPVDAQTIRLVDLRPVPRYYRNLLEKLEVRCKLESFGCQSIHPLKSLQNHMVSCMYQPDAVVDCDKGCNMTVTRREYQKNCLTHCTNIFSGQLEEMAKEVEDMKLELDINKYVTRRLIERVNRQREEILRLKSVAPSSSELPKWKSSHNMKVSSDKPNVLEPINSEQFCWAFVQFDNRLTPENSRFKIRISSINEDQYVMIGLTQDGHLDELPGRKIGSIGYYDKGELVVNDKAEFGLPKLKTGDIIECGIMYEKDFQIIPIVEVFFAVNEIVIVKKHMAMSTEGHFPTIRMGSFTNSAPKVEYLS